ncbi:MAG: toll/interleukin-1 receptor domain-containing protein [Burkholderiales bacterium]
MKVFLSHASEDHQVATEICLALRGAGHEVFFDAHDLPPGGDYNSRIRDAFDGSDALVFLVSPHSVDAGSYTLSELKFAQQKWPRPWGHVLPVMVGETAWGKLDPYLAAVTVLKPVGNRAAEVVDALARLADSAEAKAVSARIRSPLFAVQALFVGAMVVAWILMALAFSIDAPAVQQSATVAVGVLATSAIIVAAVGAVRRARDASVRSLGQAYRGVLAQPWFAVISTLLAAGATALSAWQLATLNRVSFIAPQDVELILSDRPGEVRSLGTLKAGEPARFVLRVGTRSIAYREVNGPVDALGALDPVVVPPLWSGTQRGVITIPKLDRFGTMREQGG